MPYRIWVRREFVPDFFHFHSRWDQKYATAVNFFNIYGVICEADLNSEMLEYNNHNAVYS